MTKLALRTGLPDLWNEIVNVTRNDIGLDWTEDQIATILAKIRAPSPDLLPEFIGRVMMWCKAALDGPRADDETRATVDLQLHPELPIMITVTEDGRVVHRLDPDVTVEFLQ